MKIRNFLFTDDVSIKLNVYPLILIKRLFYQFDAKHLTISSLLEVRDDMEERHMIWPKKSLWRKKNTFVNLYNKKKSH